MPLSEDNKKGRSGFIFMIARADFQANTRGAATAELGRHLRYLIGDLRVGPRLGLGLGFSLPEEPLQPCSQNRKSMEIPKPTDNLNTASRLSEAA